DWLVGAARLAGTRARGVELRRELRTGHTVAVVPRASDVREHVTAPVVEIDEGPVVEVLPAQRADPAHVGLGDLERAEQDVSGVARKVRGDGRRGHVFLGDLLGSPVERGDD